MMKIYKFIYFWLFLCCSLPVWGEQYRYCNKNNLFVLTETANRFMVDCSSLTQVHLSRNKNILDRKLRLTAVDLIGAYIVYHESGHSNHDLFQPFVDEVNLHYNAYVKDFQQEFLQASNQHAHEVIRYSCPKANYNLKAATYNKDIDWDGLTHRYYLRHKNEKSATLLYNDPHFTTTDYLLLQHDFLTGKIQQSPLLRQIQAQNDRLNSSIFEQADAFAKQQLKQFKEELPAQSPYQTFYYEELVTLAVLKDKPTYFAVWKKSLKPTHSTWEHLLSFCSSKASKCPSQEPTLTEVIMAYPGAISPYGIPQSTNLQPYQEAARLFSLKKFDEAANVLLNNIDTDGITSQQLSLLGSAFRFKQQPQQAIAFLLLSFKLNPRTTYLAGNIALTLADLKYPHTSQLCEILLQYTTDEWSKKEIQQLIQP